MTGLARRLADCIQHLAPACCGGDGFVRIGAPDKRFQSLVVVNDEAVDGGLEIDDALEDATLEPVRGEDGDSKGGEADSA